jgi:hypothetical protein
MMLPREREEQRQQQHASPMPAANSRTGAHDRYVYAGTTFDSKKCCTTMPQVYHGEQRPIVHLQLEASSTISNQYSPRVRMT